MSEAISFFTVSSQYLHTSKLLLEKMYEYENMHIIVTDDESWEYYEEKTKYSDFNIILPVLFNLYHGLVFSLSQNVSKLTVLPVQRLMDIMSIS